MEKTWIIGVGQFGDMAFQRLSDTGKERHFVLVDPIKENLLRCKGPTVAHEISDGVDFLEKCLKRGKFFCCNPDRCGRAQNSRPKTRNAILTIL